MVVAIIILILLAGVGYVASVSIKYANPYQQIFLLGKKGSGKSTLLVRYMMEYRKKGYSIYTNMTECTLPYVVHISIDDLGEYVAKPKSLVCLDEVGIPFDSRKFKTFKDSWRDYFKFQRHYKNVVIMASQSWDVDLKLRSLCDKIYICGKLGCVSYAREVRRHIVLTEPVGDAESRIADQLSYAPGSVKITWIPKYAKHFASFNPPERPFFVDPPEIPMEKKKRRSAKIKEARQQRAVGRPKETWGGKLRRVFHAKA